LSRLPACPGAEHASCSGGLEHVDDRYAALPDAELAIVPGTSHFLTQEKPDLVNTIVVDFLTKKPAATVAPVRRAGRLNASPG